MHVMAIIFAALFVITGMPATISGKAPVISAFVATPAKVTPGQSSALSWSVTGANALSINAGVGPVSGASVGVRPGATTSYTLTATNTFGSTRAAVTVMVGNPPTLAAFTASPAKVAPGQSSTLSWVVTGSPGMMMNPGVGPVTGTSVVVRPAATTAYTLSATNSFGSVTASVTVTVGSPPAIVSFTRTPALLPAGQSGTLSWSVTGASGMIISPGVGAVTGTSVVVKPAATTTYTLAATNTYGSTTATAMLVVGSPPTITSLRASPAVVAAGQSATLSWTVTGSPGLMMNPVVGPVTGTSVVVKPSSTTTYTLSAANSFGSTAATVTVVVGSPPAITGFKATPSIVAAGQSSTLSWGVTGSPGMTISPGVGAVSGTSVIVKPSSTTLYALSATNTYGTTMATATVVVGGPPTITGFKATPAAVTSGQSTTLSWAVTGSPGLMINSGVGPVTGTSVVVKPSSTTTYTMTATNSFGSATASAVATVVPASRPVVSSFFALPASAGPGIGATLHWATSGATSVSIDHGVGPVTGTSANVNPASTTTYTLTASNAAGSVTATAAVTYYPLTTVNSQLFYSEHAVYIIPASNQVTWSGTNSWGSVYSSDNVDRYVATLKGLFPDDYGFVVIAANNLTPNSVPMVQPARHTADGIGLRSTGAGIPSICRYNLGGGTVIDGAFGVLDHEIGHNWGIFLQPYMADSNGHWFSNSTAKGQMAVSYSDDGYTTVKQIAGDPVKGFTWSATDNLTLNETGTFSGQDLYLQGLAATFPDLYVLSSPVYNADHTVSYSAVAKYDQAWMVQAYGVRNPSYQTSVKRLRVGFVYIARDLNEVQNVYQSIERSISHFVNAEQIDTLKFRFQVPFLVDTQYRASINALLADLDGNQTPTLSISGPANLTSSDGSAMVSFTAVDPDGPSPMVSCVPVSPNCLVEGNNVVLTGLPSGSNFITIKAQDTGGKKAFAHFVVDVQ